MIPIIRRSGPRPETCASSEGNIHGYLNTEIALILTAATLQTVAGAMIGPTDMGRAEISLPVRHNHVTKACHSEKRKVDIIWSVQLESLSIKP